MQTKESIIEKLKEEFKCKKCKKSFLTNLYQINKGRKFCSYKCAYSHRKRDIKYDN